MPHLCWRWDGAGRSDGPDLSEERRPGWRWQRLSDKSWSSARGWASDPGAPRFGAPGASSGGRFRRGRRAMRPVARRFFYLGPSRFDPTLNGGLIALDGPPLRFLRTPTQRPQKTADVVDMIANAEVPGDDLSDSGTSPQIRGITGRSGSAKQHCFQALPCGTINLRRTAGCRTRPHRLRSPRQERRFPSPDAPPANRKSFGDLDRLIPGLEKRDGLQPPPFKRLGTAGWSHLFPPAWSIGLLLCRSQ
jgi:hypothetical protein